MATSVVTAVTPADRPVDDMAAFPEGGPEAAAAAAAALLGRPLTPMAQQTTYGSGFPAWRMATYGRTTVLDGVEPDDITVPPGFGVFSLTYQSVTGAYVVRVESPHYERFVALAPGEIDVDEGDPLPFETPYWAGEHDEFPDDPLRFDVDAWAAAGAIWMFGRDLAGHTTPPGHNFHAA